MNARARMSPFTAFFIGLFGIGAVGIVSGTTIVLFGMSIIESKASDVLGFLSLAIRARVPLGVLVDQIYAFPTFYGGVGEALGGYGRGVVRVLDPETPPLVDDPPPVPSTPIGVLAE